MPDLTADQHADAIIDALGGTTPADVAFSLAALLALAQRTEQAEAKAQHHLVGMEEAKVLWRGAEARAKQAEAEVSEVRAREKRTADEGAKRAKAQRERAEQAEKERDEDTRVAAKMVAEFQRRVSRAEAERDRLTADLSHSETERVDALNEAEVYKRVLREIADSPVGGFQRKAARDALASQEQAE